MESKTSLKNSGEAKLVLEACKILLDAGCSPSDIAIITPYNAQQQEIVARLRQRLKDSRDILVGTVHALQGSERELPGSTVRFFYQQGYLCEVLIHMLTPNQKPSISRNESPFSKGPLLGSFLIISGVILVVVQFNWPAALEAGPLLRLLILISERVR